MALRPAPWTGIVLILGGVVVSGLARPAADLPVRTTAATVAWLDLVVRFADLEPSPDAADHVADHLDTIVSLDPDFDEAWEGGALMLRVAEAGEGPRTQAWTARRPARTDATEVRP